MPAQADHPPHQWRRLLRFSVRGLIVVVLVIGAGLGWLVHEAHVQRDAVVGITAAGGSVFYDWERTNDVWISGGKPSGPRWLVDWLGVDFFGRVTEVNLGSSRLPDQALVEVGRLNQLQMVWVFDASFTDAGLVHLKGLTNLSVLGLSGTQVTDAGLVHLKGLTQLSELRLNGTQVTDAGLVHLKGLTNLKTLNLIDTRVTDAGARELNRALPNLHVPR